MTETADGRIATFGSVAPPSLPGCPEQLKAQVGTFDADARVDAEGITDARVCSYTLADRTGLSYGDPQAHDATPSQVAALRAALEGLAPLDPASVDCLGPITPKATEIFVLRKGRVEAFSKSRSACAPWVGQKHDFSSSTDLMTALDAIVG